MENSTDLIIVEKIVPAKLFLENGMDEILTGIRSKLNEFKGDASTENGRKEIVSMAYKVSRSKTLLDTVRKEFIKDAKKKIDKANGVWKPARETLDKWKNEIRQPVTEWEEAEKRRDEERIRGIHKRIDAISETFDGLEGWGSVDQLKSVITQLEAVKIEPEEYFEFTAEASEVLLKTLASARQALETRERLDREAEEQKKESERLAAEREKQEKEAAKLRVEQEKIDAEKRKLAEEKAAIERAEFERKTQEEAKIKAEKAAKEKAEREEQERIANEQAEAEEHERQERLKPDKEKLYNLAGFLQENVPWPELDNEEAIEVLHRAHKDIYDVGEMLRDASEKM